ncbi:MAG TPA: PQQ-binding-like beta-propeller repeat protein [Ktedonobacteraceae bacterium]
MSRDESIPQCSALPDIPAPPKKLLCLYAIKDARFFRELQSHLYIWVRQQKIVWLEVSAGDAAEEVMQRHLCQADLIFLLSSAYLIATDTSYQAMQAALEERTSRQVPVIPILARPFAWRETPYAALEVLPDDERPISLWPDRDEAYQHICQRLAQLLQLHAALSNPCASTSVPATMASSAPDFQARTLDADYVARPQVFERLKRSLLHPDTAHPTAITTALHGAGGFGKTTLALVLVHDPEVRAAFPDGIFWIELGEQPPGSLTLFNRLLPVLGDQATEAGTLEEARIRWQRVLAAKTCLLVIDDVWQAAHLTPLLEGGPRSRRLVTTRNDHVLPQSAQRMVVDAMSEQEAIAVLTQGLAIEGSQDSTWLPLAQLVMHLGCWPLLLSVARGLLATQLRYGRPLPEALEVIWQTYQGQRGISIGAEVATGFRETVESSLRASFRQLQAVMAASYQPVERYGELAIFPEDTDIPIAALRLFWQATAGLKAWETDDLCMQLAGLALVVNCDLQTGTIRLHDVTRQFLIERAGTSLPLWQGQFLDAVRQGLGIQRWAEVAPANTYLWQHLVFHLCQAERWEELAKTLTDLGYLANKVLFQGVSALEADLKMASMASATHIPQPDAARFASLHHHLVRLSHQLRQLSTLAEIGSVLLSYLGPHEPFVRQAPLLEHDLPRPHLTAWYPLPEGASRALLRTLVGHAAIVTSCALSADGRLVVSSSQDGTLKLWNKDLGAERLTLRGHSSAVTDCALSADGRLVASACSDHTLKLWDATTGAERHTLRGHSSSVIGCALSADGRLVASASQDHTLKLWDAATGAERHTLRGHAAIVTGCALSADGRLVVSSSQDGTLKLWDAASGVERHTLRGHSSAVTDCALSADGRLIVSASSDHTLKLWDAASGVERQTLRGHSFTVTGCALSADGRLIASASQDGTLKLWDEVLAAQRLTLRNYSDTARGCALSTDRRLIVSASWDGTLKLWNAATGAERHTLRGHSSRVTGCALSADGNLIVSSSYDKTLKLWDAATGTELLTLRGHSAIVTDCALSADGRLVVSASWDGTLKLWDTATGAERLTLRGHSSGVTGCALSADGSLIVSSSYDKTLKLWDAATGAERHTLRGHSFTVYGCALSADGRLVVSASSDHTLKLWDASTGAELLTLPGHCSSVTGCALSADGRLIVSASWDGTLKLWDAASGAELLTLHGYSSEVNGCALSADGRLIISASWDGTLKLWDVASGAERLALRDHPSFGTGCALSADGRLIISASWDQTLKLWDEANGAERHALRCPCSWVTGCVLSADGHLIVSTSQDGTLKLWNVVSGAERHTLRGHLAGVTGCALSTDGHLIVSASQDGTLKLWDAVSGAERQTLRGHANSVNGCALSADGRLIVSASSDHTLKLWDAASGLCLLTFPADGALYGCAFHPDGRHLVACGTHGLYWLRLIW